MSDPSYEAELAMQRRASIMDALERQGGRSLRVQEWSIEQERQRTAQYRARVRSGKSVRSSITAKKEAKAQQEGPRPFSILDSTDDDPAYAEGVSPETQKAAEQGTEALKNVATKVGDAWELSKEGGAPPGPGQGPRPGSWSHEVSAKSTQAAINLMGDAEKGVEAVTGFLQNTATNLERKAQANLDEGYSGRAIPQVAGAQLLRMGSGLVKGATFPFRPVAWAQAGGAVVAGVSALASTPLSQRAGSLRRGLGRLADPHVIADLSGQILGGVAVSYAGAKVSQALAPAKTTSVIKRGQGPTWQEKPQKWAGSQQKWGVRKEELLSTVDETSTVNVIKSFESPYGFKREVAWGRMGPPDGKVKVFLQTGHDLVPAYAAPGMGTPTSVIHRRVTRVTPSPGLTPTRLDPTITTLSRPPALEGYMGPGLLSGLGSSLALGRDQPQDMGPSQRQPQLVDIAEAYWQKSLMGPGQRPTPVTEPEYMPHPPPKPPIEILDTPPKVIDDPRPTPPHQRPTFFQEPVLQEPGQEDPMPMPMSMPMPVMFRPGRSSDRDFRIPVAPGISRRRRGGPSYGFKTGKIKMSRAEIRELIG